MGYEFLEHTADMKFRATGKSLNEAFEESVRAVSEFLGKGEKIKAVRKKKVKIKGNDKESLFYNFLEEIVFLLDTENFVVAHSRVKIRGNSASVEFFGDDVKNYKSIEHIKAATYAEMFVGKRKGKWEIVGVMDI